MSNTILTSDLATMTEREPGIFGAKRWRLWVLLGELALIGTGVAFLYWPVMTVANVTYQGPADWEAEVRSLAMLPSDGNILHFVPTAAESHIESRFGDRADAQVRIELPNCISIRMIPYQPRLWGDGEIGIAPDGSLLLEPAQRPDLPTWRPGIEWEESRPLADRAREAAGAWDELRQADRRYELATREWTCDPIYGWTATAADGRTRIALGHTLIEERAKAVSQLLDQGDTLLAKPCFIDARFAGQILLYPIPEIKVDSTHLDSTAVIAAGADKRTAQDAKPVKGIETKGRT